MDAKHWPCGKHGRLPSWRTSLFEAGRTSLIRYGKPPVADTARLIRDHDLELAAADLRLAISQGFKDPAILRSHPEASLLFERDDLKSLIRGVLAPDPPAKAQKQK